MPGENLPLSSVLPLHGLETILLTTNRVVGGCYLIRGLKTSHLTISDKDDDKRCVITVFSCVSSFIESI